MPYYSKLSGRSNDSLWKTILQRFDFLLLGLILVTVFYGIIVIYGATYSVANLSHFAHRQILWVLVGLTAFMIILIPDYRWFRHGAWPLYLITVLALLFLLVAGREIKGARSWFSFGPYRLQPSEFAKITVVLCLAHYLAGRERTPEKIRDIIIPTLIASIPAGLIFIQPDLGTASLFFPLLLVMLYASGTTFRLILMIILISAWLGLSAYPFLKPYQKARLKVFVNPEHDPTWQGYNIRQAEISLGSGGPVGKGWKQGTQTRLRFLPERHTDFIYSSLGEQFGFAGCLALIILYSSILFRAARPAWLARSHFARLTTVGLVSCLMIHLFFNIGMTLRLLPVTGLPLPLFSYGGSFLLTNFIIFGIIQNINMRRHHY